MKETIFNYDDLLDMLDSLLREPTQFWDGFYADREKGIPFFVNAPDENLVEYFEKNLIKPGRVLELGCGPGRNALYLDEKGCEVDAVDLSEEALNWAKERAEKKTSRVNFINKNLFDLNLKEGAYDFVYDSGCFHHIAPHRRMTYIELVKKALKPNGFFALTCFTRGGELGGAEISDWEVYRVRSLMGGLGYSEEKLKATFKDFKVIELRKMKDVVKTSDVFGYSGLMAGLFQKNT